MYMKKPATQKITMGEFRRMSSDLRMRGFVEEPQKAPQGVMHDMMLIASYRRQFSNFSVSVGASREATDVLGLMQRGEREENAGASLWAKCDTEASRSVGEWARLFPHKSHYVSGSDGGSWRYHADIVPIPDPSILIDSCLKLGDSVARIRMDAEFASAIDAKEVHDVMITAGGQLRRDNSFAAYLSTYLAPLLDSMRGKKEYEFARIMQDALALQALAQVADK